MAMLGRHSQHHTILVIYHQIVSVVLLEPYTILHPPLLSSIAVQLLKPLARACAPTPVRFVPCQILHDSDNPPT